MATVIVFTALPKINEPTSPHGGVTALEGARKVGSLIVGYSPGSKDALKR